MIRVGCCGWPVRREEYFRRFGLVEIRESFYNLPQLKTVEHWRATAPEGFEFVLKAPQLITHEASSPTYRRLRQKLTNTQKARYGAFKSTREVLAAWESTLTLAKTLRSWNRLLFDQDRGQDLLAPPGRAVSRARRR